MTTSSRFLDSINMTKHFGSSWNSVVMGDLNQYFRKNKVLLYQKRDLMHGIAKGISYLHNNNIIHRDVKPANILIASEIPLTPKLADFDISKVLDFDAETSVMSSNVGTLAFKAPEFFIRPSGKLEYHRNVDVYAAGLTFLAMIQAGEKCRKLVPHIETPQDDSDLYAQSIGQLIAERIKYKKYKVPELNVVDQKKAEVTSSAENLTETLKKIIRKMTCFNPKERVTANQVEFLLLQVSSMHFQRLLMETNIEYWKTTWKYTSLIILQTITDGQPQLQQQHSSSHQENSSNNMQQVPTSISSQMRSMASTGRPGNPYRLLGSDRKRLIAVINDVPVDPPEQPPPQQLLLPLQQQQSMSNKELHDRNGESECASMIKPGESQQVQQKRMGLKRHNLLAAPFGASLGGQFVDPQGPNVVMRCEVDMSQYQQRLNELITITQPNKHGWEIMEFQEKFTEYLQAPENDYKEITKILRNKKILGKRFPCIDDFKQMVSDDLEAISMKINPPSITLEQKQKQEVAIYRASLQQETVIPRPTPKEVIDQDAAYLTNKQLREAQKLAPKIMKQGVKRKREVSSRIVIDDVETISQKTTESMISEKIGRQIPEENRKRMKKETFE